MAISKKVSIYDEYITLSQFLKIVDLVQSGGEANGGYPWISLKKRNLALPLGELTARRAD